MLTSLRRSIEEATIRLDTSGQTRDDDTVAVSGVVTPARADQRILIDVLFPNGTTRRTVQTRSASTGQFDATVSLLDGTRKLMLGAYQVQAFIFQASCLNNAASNVVFVSR